MSLLKDRDLERMMKINKGQRFVDAPYSLKEEDVFPPISTLCNSICSSSTPRLCQDAIFSGLILLEQSL